MKLFLLSLQISNQLMSHKFLYEYEFNELSKTKMEGKMVAVSDQGDIVVSIKDNTIYFWEIKEEAIKAFYVTAKFTPLKNNIYE